MFNKYIAYFTPANSNKKIRRTFFKNFNSGSEINVSWSIGLMILNLLRQQKISNSNLTLPKRSPVLYQYIIHVLKVRILPPFIGPKENPDASRKKHSENFDPILSVSFPMGIQPISRFVLVDCTMWWCQRR